MIGRALSITTALLFTTTAVAGILGLVVLDMVGEEAVLGAVGFVGSQPQKSAEAELVVPPATTPAQVIVEAAPVLEGAEDITFFTQVPVEGALFDVVTGTQFASPADLAEGLVADSWCYVMAEAPDGVMRRINLAAQKAVESPIYEALKELPTKELALFKLSATALEALAKTHCRLGKSGIVNGQEN